MALQVGAHRPFFLQSTNSPEVTAQRGDAGEWPEETPKNSRPYWISMFTRCCFPLIGTTTADLLSPAGKYGPTTLTKRDALRRSL